MCAEHIDGVRRPSSRYCSRMSRREAGSDSVTTGKVAKKRDGQFMVSTPAAGQSTILSSFKIAAGDLKKRIIKD